MTYAPISASQLFVSNVRDRSRENQAAFQLLWQQGLLSPAVALVRQELDSMVRVIFLIDATPLERTTLIEASLAGSQWTRRSKRGKPEKITDRDLIEHALTHHPWTKQVYQFGCNFIHLSRWHGHRTLDPVTSVLPRDRAEIASLITAEGLPEMPEFTFEALVNHAPYSIQKIGSNLASYLRSLEAQLGLTPPPNGSPL